MFCQFSRLFFEYRYHVLWHLYAWTDASRDVAETNFNGDLYNDDLWLSICLIVCKTRV